MLSEKAKSRAQQRFFGMVRSAQKGEMDNPSSEVLDAADSMKVGDVKKFAKTKHKGLPEKKKMTKTEGVTYGYKGKKYKKLPAHVKTPAGWGNDDRGELGKAKDAITDKLGITNTKKHGVLAKENITLQDANGNDFLEIVDLIKPEPLVKKEITEDVSYKEFTSKAREASTRMKKEKQEKQKRNAESAYRDKVTKGVKFYDKKGKGHIRSGKKVYD